MPGKTHMISVRLTDAERRKLSQICAVSGLPVSAAIREMIGGITIRHRPPQELHDLYVEINLIGKTTDEAIPLLDKYLDDAYLAHLPSVRIVHGKGTGALRNAVQAHLKRL